jgi:hypothetical protein
MTKKRRELFEKSLEGDPFACKRIDDDIAAHRMLLMIVPFKWLPKRTLKKIEYLRNLSKRFGCDDQVD